MSDLVLYRKHRPRQFDEVVGQEHIVAAIANAFIMDRVAHAYLFSGPRGVGKTTIARLIAKGLNCVAAKEKPCNTCVKCEEFNAGKIGDLTEIDAASNRGIDEIRELRDGVRFVPSQGKYKTYIIDECHMLTKDAFNALLKTLEEPPAHAVFILATTELEKVPATIISRTQHYQFRRPNVAQIAGRLASVAKKEKVELDADAGRLIAFAAEGGMRDAESILGQIMAAADKKITRADVEDTLGLPKRESGKKLFELVAKKDLSGAFACIQNLHEAGHDISYLQRSLLHYFRNALLLKTDAKLSTLVAEEMLPDELECINANMSALSEEYLLRAVNIIMQNLQQFRKTPIPQLPLEVTVAELIQSNKA